jgi:hypothetical protein
MNYKLYTDKLNKFQCTLQFEGTSLEDSQARVILETNNVSYLFKGKISENGLCEFDLPKLKGIMTEGTTGKVRLEVIADDMYFEPKVVDFVVEVTKKVTATIQEQVETKKPAIMVSEITLTETEAPKITEKKEEVVTEKVQTSKENLLNLIKKNK